MRFKNLFLAVPHFLFNGLEYSAKGFGFHDWNTMTHYIFLLVNKSVTSLLLISSLFIGMNGWIEDWIFSPLYTYVVFMALMLAEITLGTVKAITIDGEKFNWDKAGRIVPKLIAHTFALSAAFHMSNAEPLFSWMPSTVFIFFSIQNFMKCILHLVDMKSLDGSFANFMRNKFSQNNDFTPTENENQRKGDQDPS